jgi:hypothetical protein
MTNKVLVVYNETAGGIEVSRRPNADKVTLAQEYVAAVYSFGAGNVTDPGENEFTVVTPDSTVFTFSLEKA